MVDIAESAAFVIVVVEEEVVVVVEVEVFEDRVGSVLSRSTASTAFLVRLSIFR